VVTEVQAETDSRIESRGGRISAFFSNRRGGAALVWLILLAIIIFAAIVAPPFLGKRNIYNVFKQVTALGIVSVGQTFVILLAGIDISVGAVVSLVSCVNSHVMPIEQPYAIPLGVALSLLIGLVVGLANGLGVTKLKVSPFMMTLGMMSIVQGAAIFLRPQPGGIVPRGFGKPLTGNIGPVPVPMIWLGAAALIGFFILTRTLFGRHLYATGGNEASARLSGIHTDRVKILTFMVCGLMAAVAGLFITARIRTGDALVGTSFGLDSITAVAIGGTSLMGGRGGVVGTIAGAFMVALLANILNLIGVSSYYQYIVKGLLIIIAVAVYAER
jgi:ribose transport system permease protein